MEELLPSFEETEELIKCGIGFVDNKLVDFETNRILFDFGIIKNKKS